MDYDDALAEMIGDAADSFWRTLKATPPEKLDWKPAPDARSMRVLAGEVAMTTVYSAELIRSRQSPAMPEGDWDTMSLEDLEKAHRGGITDYLKAVRDFPAADLHQEPELSWGKMNFLQVIAYPYWNLVYHWGQVSYIQTMYGDKETH